MLQKWACQAKEICLPNVNNFPNFNGGPKWLSKFKKIHNVDGPPNDLKIWNQCDDNTLIKLESSDPNENVVVRRNIFKQNKVIVPYEQKVKVVNTALEHPDWTIKMIRTYTQCYVKDRSVIAKWIKQLKNGGTLEQKIKAINEKVYEKCIDYIKNHNENLNYLMIKNWALAAKNALFSENCKNFKFAASRGWFTTFKNTYCSTEISLNLELSELNTSTLKNDISDSDKKADIFGGKEAPYTDAPLASQAVNLNSDDINTESLRLEDKMKVVQLACDNPTWPLRILRKVSGIKQLKTNRQLKIWAIQCGRAAKK
ncbi:uncharacterized protein LOC122849114 [Aphidius gifuensis]|nr:uncharacterized protein LOC122849114 [Aphidius gifuensis]